MQSPPSDPLPVPSASLMEAFADIPEPRRATSVQYPLPALLSLAVCALLAHHHSVLAMAEWGARQTAETLTALGVPTGQTPCQSTLHRLFTQLDGAVLAQRLTAWFQTQC